MGDATFTRRFSVFKEFQPIVATGGTINNVTIGGIDYRIHAFTNTGTSTFTVSNKGTDGKVDVLVVAGGGGGGIGNNDRGGGGAGGLVLYLNYPITTGAKNVFVSAGVVGGDNSTPVRAQNSLFDSITAIGGGPADGFATGINGGSGGGGGGGGGRGLSIQQGTNPNATLEAGNQGGNGARFEYGGDGGNIGGGGGGAGAPGQTPASKSAPGGNGGIGLNMSQYFTTSYGQNGYFAGGGAGTGNVSGNGLGGLGGGGNPFTSGIANTGGGGGASSSATTGGSGIVIIRYPLVKVN